MIKAVLLSAIKLGIFGCVVWPLFNTAQLPESDDRTLKLMAGAALMVFLCVAWGISEYCYGMARYHNGRRDAYLDVLSWRGGEVEEAKKTP